MQPATDVDEEMKTRGIFGMGHRGAALIALARIGVFAACLVPAAFGASAKAADAGVAKPNFIIIMADDLGYGDLSCYGSTTINTPNIDALAAQGIRFSDYHSNGAVCSPTRAALVTGRYQQRVGVPKVITAERDRDKGLPLNEVTFAEALKPSGYASGIFGKWHLGYLPEFSPVRQGFDEYIGYVSGNVDYHSHIDQAGYSDWWHADNLHDDAGYTTDLITADAVSFIRRHKDEPFVLYVPHEAPHGPYQGRNTPAERVAGRKGTVPTPGKNRKALYKEMVEDMDEGVGAIVDVLKELHLDRNTLVIFVSDNGAVKLGSNGVLHGFKGSVWEGGHRVPGIAWWPGRIPAGRTCDETVMSMDLFPTLLQIAGVPIPGNLDGVSLADLLLKGTPLAPRTLFWQYGADSAVREGDWKLVLNGETESGLFNLGTDLGELHDLSAQHPDVRKRLEDELAAWEKDVTPGTN